jgi:hypothetical protein
MLPDAGGEHRVPLGEIALRLTGNTDILHAATSAVRRDAEASPGLKDECCRTRRVDDGRQHGGRVPSDYLYASMSAAARSG